LSSASRFAKWLIMKANRIGLVALFVLSALGVSHQGNESRAQNPTTSEQNPPPPTPKPTPAEDTERYVTWMEKRGKPIRDKPHEVVSLRAGDWGFFYHGDRPVGSWTPLMDRVALDRNGRAVTEAESSDWFVLLGTGGLDAAGALKRIAWLFNAEALNPSSAPAVKLDKISAPTLILKDGVITFHGWWEAYSDPPYSRRITITTTPTGTKLVLDR
jgi:hypothetical protein